MFEVHIIHPNSVGGGSDWVTIQAKNAKQAKQYAAAQYPGAKIGNNPKQLF